VFVSPTGGPLDDGDVCDAFYRGLAAAELEDLRELTAPIVFHDLRHTFGTLAVQVGPVTDVQAYMGHADIKTTMRYVHHVPAVSPNPRNRTPLSATQRN
jgi:integrase